MQKIQAGDGALVSQVALGCMRISSKPIEEVVRLIETSVEYGITFFDHADIYGGGQSEAVFGEALKRIPGLRNRIRIQSKCGIRKGYYDFSKEHIIASAENSLRRLGIETLDVLLLHRPDALMVPEEVAEAFCLLHQSGKVLSFGVSNHNVMQMELLKSAVEQPIVFNQLQMSLMFTGMIDQGLNVNMKNASSIDHDSGILDYCRLNKVTIQVWSPLQYGFFEGVFVGNERFPELNRLLSEMAVKYGISETAVAIAWLLRHPANMQVVLGTTQPERVREISRAADVCMSRPDWYALYRAAGNQLP